LRYSGTGMDDAVLDKLNKQIEIELQEEGIAVSSVTTIRGKCVIHLAITNHRTRREDLEVFLREVIRIGDKLARPGIAT